MTYVSLARRIAFIHIPRTGGTSIVQTLGAHVGSLALAPHLRARDVRRQLGEEIWDGLESIAVVRDSLDWLRSTWRYARSQPLHALFVPTAILEFTDFARAAAHVAPLGWRQSDFLCDEDGRPLVRHVLRFERLVEEWAQLAARLELEPELPQRNASPACEMEPLAPDDRRIALGVMAEDAIRLDLESRRDAEEVVDGPWSRVAGVARRDWFDCTDACGELAELFLAMGEYDATEVCARRAIELAPKAAASVTAHRCLAALPERLGKAMPDPADVRAAIDRIARGVARAPYRGLGGVGGDSRGV